MQISGRVNRGKDGRIGPHPKADQPRLADRAAASTEAAQTIASRVPDQERAKARVGRHKTKAAMHLFPRQCSLLEEDQLPNGHKTSQVRLLARMR